MNCRNCSTPLPYGAMFCGECGATVLPPRIVSAPPPPRTSDTVILQPLAPVFRPAIDRDPVIDIPPPAAASTAAAPTPTPAPAPAPSPPPSPSPAPSAAPIRMPPPAADPGPAAAGPLPVLRHDAVLAEDLDDLESTRIVRRAQAGERFVLQFSTGDSATVTGSGLVGRNPVVQPGEAFDQLVVIVDPGKSVSKTHAEFGQTNGVFWVSDRFSGNGTVIRQPDQEPQRAEAGKRYPAVRGSRIDIAEQFFVVS